MGWTARVDRRAFRGLGAVLATSVLVLLCLFAVAGPVAAQSGAPASLVMYPLPTPAAEPSDLTVGPDGNLWSPYYFAGTIARITPAGTVNEFAPAGANFIGARITTGGDGNLWLLDSSSNSIDSLTPDGASLTKFPLAGSNSLSDGITLGPDGNVWFTGPSHIGRITPAGVVTQFTVRGLPYAFDIVAGPDGNLWFTTNANKIGRITPNGAITLFDLPSGIDGTTSHITKGPDGNLWYTKSSFGTTHFIGRITTAGVATEFVLPAGTHSYDITAGPDRNLWFTDRDNKEIGRITPSGQVGLFTPSDTPAHGRHQGADHRL
ncbi:MAG: virginiamycin B lyase [Actinobacteria bacterium]|nr:virginiamycin B lyase [Actinomycetota bacterium]